LKPGTALSLEWILRIVGRIWTDYFGIDGARKPAPGLNPSTGCHAGSRGFDSRPLLRLRCAYPGMRLLLAGFSFGAFVQARVARTLADCGAPAWRVCLAGMPFGEVQGGRRYDTPDGIPDALIVHGEHDERVHSQAVLDWARPQAQPVVVIPGADHFFTGRLHVLRSPVMSHVRTS